MYIKSCCVYHLKMGIHDLDMCLYLFALSCVLKVITSLVLS